MIGRRRTRRRAGGRAHGHSLARERGLVGALILEPAMIRVMAPLRPPAWFEDARCLAVMRALFCLQRLLDLSVKDVVDALEVHGALELELVGGESDVEALIAPGPHLEAGRSQLAAARRRLEPVEGEALVVLAMRVLLAERAPGADLKGPADRDR